MRKTIKILIISLLTVVLLFASFMIFKTVREYKRGERVYTELQSGYVEEKTVKEKVSDEETEESELLETAPISVDFPTLLEQNADITGWLYCPNTPINYPVVQAADNSQYLHADLNGNYLAAGTLFADYRNGALGEDANYIIYGHNMKDGSMFHSLTEYNEQSYYDEHPVIYYLTPNGDYKIELFAGLAVKKNARIYTPNPDEAELADFLETAKASSTFKSDIEITETDTPITLSTCSDENGNERYIVLGKLNRV